MGKRSTGREVFYFKANISDIFEDANFFSGFESAIWTPFIDMYETGSSFVVQAELPDVLESDISIKMEGNVLRISGIRRLRKEGRNYYQVERSYGVFSRSLVLSSAVDKDAIRATLKDGMLRILLPKKHVELPKHVEITDL